MITGAAHALVPSLAQSLYEFRAQIEAGRAPTSSDQTPEATTPAPPSAEPSAPPSGPRLTLDQLELESQARRDSARQLAVQAIEMQHTRELFETYVETSSSLRGEDDADELRVYTPDPAKVYQMSLEYQRRMDLVNAFEEAARGDSAASRLDVVV